MDMQIIPAILVETIDEFKERIELAEDFAETVQWDIMDGQFVENETFSDFESIQEVDTTLNIEAHLMVENPEEILEDLAQAGIDRVIAHVESTTDLPFLVERMKEQSYEIGLALNPETDIEEIEAVVEDLDVVMVMTVVPGAGGQSFLEEQLEKVEQLRAKYPDLAISVDGGVNMETIVQAKKAGANWFCTNSAIFESPDPAHAYEMMLNQIS